MCSISEGAASDVNRVEGAMRPTAPVSLVNREMRRCTFTEPRALKTSAPKCSMTQ